VLLENFSRKLLFQDVMSLTLGTRDVQRRITLRVRRNFSITTFTPQTVRNRTETEIVER